LHLVWEVVLLDEVDDWFVDLARRGPGSATLVAGAIDLLEREGPTLGRPAVDRIKGLTPSPPEGAASRIDR
jgi:hypothetical protein